MAARARCQVSAAALIGRFLSHDARAGSRPCKLVPCKLCLQSTVQSKNFVCWRSKNVVADTSVAALSCPIATRRM
eukprot:776651-Rhodomonas_salina.2